ncbi:MAG TPA: cytochrome c3 family protein [Pyrinomonadaceae bacterium]|nr:cytochrome c3 family protein [Pyrinomonadaceae bacterium]
MKVFTILTLALISAILFLSGWNSSVHVSAQEGKKQPDVLMLGQQAKLGAIKFSHTDHVTKNRSVDGTKPVACVECHHTAQPAAEAAKHPPHKTAWPADRTTTLTADLFEKDASAPPVNVCHECHARAEEKPKLLPAIPTIKVEGSAEPVVLNSQQAFHRNCGGCHDEVAKARETTAPTSKKCVACHKKTAA